MPALRIYRQSQDGISLNENMREHVHQLIM